MERIPIAHCLFTNVLGGRTFSAELRRVIDNHPGVRARYTSFDVEDYARFVAPLPYSLSDSATVSYAIRKKMDSEAINLSLANILVFQSLHLALPFARLIKNKPTIIALDSTPRLGHVGAILQRNRILEISRSAASRVLELAWWRPLCASVDFFLARTEAVASSLEKHYGVDSKKISVTYLPMDHGSVHDYRQTGGLPKLLFVGNDFERKGGNELLRIYKKYLLGKVRLQIVSNDPRLKQRDLGVGVEVFSNVSRDKVISLCRECDVFLFPSYNDALGLVLCEAIAQGAPVIARQSISQNEIVIDNYNGFCLPHASDDSLWGSKILELLDNRSLRESFARNSLKLAEKKFSRTLFESKVIKAIDAVSATVHKNCFADLE